MLQSKNGKVFVAVVAAVLLIIVVLIIVFKKPDDKNTEISSSPVSSGINIVGTWYSDKPDSLTFTKDGQYQGNAWNGGNAWLLAGNYTINGNYLILEGALDGTTTLTVSSSGDGSKILTGKYTYYSSEGAAKAQLQTNEQQASAAKENLIPNTINNLIGEWTSLDGMTTCVYTETSLTVHFKGSDSSPADTLYYEYEVVSDKQMMITENGVSNPYAYSIYEKDGAIYLASPIKAYAPTYIKGSLDEEDQSPDPNRINNPDMSKYTDEMAEYVNATLIGTWKGTFDEWETPTTEYSVYAFSPEGTYSFKRGETVETGTYTTTHDPNNLDYHSCLLLDNDGEIKKVQFYFYDDNPMRLVTDDNNNPTFRKQ